MTFDDTRRLSSETIRAALASTIGRWTEGTEHRATPIPDLAFFRRESPTPPGICQVEPCVVLVVQGAKRMLVGDDTFAYNSERFLIASLDIPASKQVIEASSGRPCLGLVLKLDLRFMTDLISQSHLPPPNDRSVATGIALGTVTATLLESFKRLTDLLDEPEAIEVLAPLVKREIHYRLLTSDQAGGCVRSRRSAARATSSPGPSSG